MVSTDVRSAWGGRLLLFAALLLGIVTMHTLGHPSGDHGEHGTGPAGTTVSSAPAAPRMAGMTTPATVRSDPRAAEVTEAARATKRSAVAHHPAASSPRSPLHGMDPMSVCLAVLAAWGVALLGAGLLTGRPFAWSTAPACAVLLRTLRPRPPPRKTVLASLSVLRI